VTPRSSRVCFERFEVVRQRLAEGGPRLAALLVNLWHPAECAERGIVHHAVNYLVGMLGLSSRLSALSSRRLGCLDGLPHLEWRRRHCDVVHAEWGEGVEDGADDDGERRRAAAFAAGLDA